jgi:hypothetical protein
VPKLLCCAWRYRDFHVESDGRLIGRLADALRCRNTMQVFRRAAVVSGDVQAMP